MEQMITALESIGRLINKTTEDLENCNDLSQKKTHAEIIKLLCESMGVFLNAMSDYGPFPFEDLDDDYDDFDFRNERSKSLKGNKKGKKKDLPF